MKDDPYYCPDCGHQSIRVIERIPNGIDEVKIACSCERCRNLWYMIRSVDDDA